jgi:hypothetical protein
VQLAKYLGNSPASWFPLRAKNLKPQLFGKALGIVPVDTKYIP